jgi:hypothetical protein
MKHARLEEFRQAGYKHLGRAKDATFELTDAILLTRNIYCLAELSLSPIFVTDNPLPWQKSQGNLTPGRVAQALGGVFAAIGTPTSAPKPRGKSPGWQPGKKRHRKNRCPIVKKTVTRPRKEPSVAV